MSQLIESKLNQIKLLEEQMYTDIRSNIEVVVEGNTTTEIIADWKRSEIEDTYLPQIELLKQEIVEIEANPPHPLETFSNVNLLNELQSEEILSKVNEEDLEGEQLDTYKKVYNRKLKFEVRKEFVKEVGDLPDQLADVDKQVQMITPIVVRVFMFNLALLNKLHELELIDKNAFLLDLENDGIIDEELIGKYETFGSNYLGAIQAGIYEDRVDVEPDEEVLVNDIMLKNIKKGNLAKTYIENKKV